MSWLTEDVSDGENILNQCNTSSVTFDLVMLCTQGCRKGITWLCYSTWLGLGKLLYNLRATPINFVVTFEVGKVALNVP